VRVDETRTLTLDGSYDNVLAKCILTVFDIMCKVNELNFLVMIFECS